MNKDFFVVDFEFTKYTQPTGKPRAFFSEIIEVGAVLISHESHEIIGDLEAFVKPHFFPKQAAESMDFCMITESDMENAIEFRDMIKQISALFVSGETYFVSWGNADFHVIAKGCDRHMLPNPISKDDCIDLAAAYKALKEDRLTTGLSRAIEELGIDKEGFGHTAYDDAVNTGKILLKLISGGWKPEDYFV